MYKSLLLTVGHTQLPGSSVAHVGSFGYISGKSTLKRSDAATAYTGRRCTPFLENDTITKTNI